MLHWDILKGENLLYIMDLDNIQNQDSQYLQSRQKSIVAVDSGFTAHS